MSLVFEVKACFELRFSPESMVIARFIYIWGSGQFKARYHVSHKRRKITPETKGLYHWVIAIYSTVSGSLP